jgi:hypothetical protein
MSSPNTNIQKIKASTKSLLKKKSAQSPSSLARQEKAKIEQDAMRADLLNRQLNNAAFEQIITLRTTYSKYILIFLIVWSSLTFIIVLLSSWEVYGFYINSDVLSVLIGTCFGNVLALVGVIVKGIFLPQNK